MSIGIIDMFEVINVCNNQTIRETGSCAIRMCILQFLGAAASVIQFGQSIQLNQLSKRSLHVYGGLADFGKLIPTGYNGRVQFGGQIAGRDFVNEFFKFV